MRTRFAPSPTGFLHVGGVRTALFAWLMAKKTKGTFVLRLEDTDRAREVPGAAGNILKTLAWAGLRPDEGVMLDERGEITEKGSFGPYIQSKRTELYRTHAETLLKQGHAYRCFCSPERLEEMRTQQEKRHQTPMYDLTCLDLPEEEVKRRIAAGEKHVLRMKIPREETIVYDDEIYGKLSFKGHTVDDQVLLKSDGFPTYHLAHVVDDHLMEMDMVIRGEEWLSSLPKHLLLFRYFGWQPPKYAHVPLLLNPDRTKLSKRQSDVAAEHYIEKGYLSEALMNFLALLGWNPGTEQEIFSREELIGAFSLDRVQKSGAVFDLQKLNWLQGQWIRRIPLKDFAARIQPLVAAKFKAAGDDEHFTEKAALIQERITLFPEAAEMLAFFYERPVVSEDVLVNPKQGVTESDLPKIIDFLIESLSSIPDSEWRKDVIINVLGSSNIARFASEAAGGVDLSTCLKESQYLGPLRAACLKNSQYLWPLRAALTGRLFSPGAYEVAALLGKEETIERLKKVA